MRDRTRLAPWFPVALASMALGCTAVLGLDGRHDVECMADDGCRRDQICTVNRCVAAPCDDGLPNGAETDVDCGGLFNACLPCGDGLRCETSADCVGGVCTSANTCCTPPCPLWAKQFGGLSDQTASAVTTDKQGNIVAAGYFGGDLVFGDGALPYAADEDAFVVKIDSSNGHPLWSKSFGGDGYDYARVVAAGPAGEVVVAGEFNGSVDFGDGNILTSGGGTLGHNVFVARLDSGGKLLWSERFGGAAADVRGLVVDAGGDIVLTGFFTDTIDFGGGAMINTPGPDGANDLFVAKLDSSGKHIWSHAFGDSDKQEPAGLALDGDGDVVVVGRFGGVIDFGGSSVPIASAGNLDVFVAKLSSSGETLWSERFGGIQSQEGGGVATGADGSIVLTGRFQSLLELGGGVPDLSAMGKDMDVFLVKLDAQGHHLWSTELGTTSQDAAYSVAMDPQGRVVVTGLLGSGTIVQKCGKVTNYGAMTRRDVFMAEFDGGGQCVWIRGFGTGSEEVAALFPHVSIDLLGNLVLVGGFQQAVDFGVGNLVPTGDQTNKDPDAFVVKFAR